MTPAPAAVSTTVFNLATGEELTYSLPAREAVNAAFEQYEKKNWNTWTYGETLDQVQVSPRGVACRGDFSARVQA